MRCGEKGCEKPTERWSLAGAGPWGMPEVEALPKSIRAQNNGTGSWLAGFSPSPEQNQTLLRKLLPRAAPSLWSICRAPGAPVPTCHDGAAPSLPSSPSWCSHRAGRESSCAGLAPAAAPSRARHAWAMVPASPSRSAGPACQPRAMAERAISNPNHPEANPPRRVAAFKVCRAVTGAKSIRGFWGLFGLNLQQLWRCGEGEVGRSPAWGQGQLRNPVMSPALYPLKHFSRENDNISCVSDSQRAWSPAARCRQPSNQLRYLSPAALVIVQEAHTERRQTQTADDFFPRSSRSFPAYKMFPFSSSKFSHSRSPVAAFTLSWEPHPAPLYPSSYS